MVGTGGVAVWVEVVYQAHLERGGDGVWYDSSFFFFALAGGLGVGISVYVTIILVCDLNWINLKMWGYLDESGG